MRLTKKRENGIGSWTQLGDKYIPAHNIKHKKCVNKLGQLEDIEEELGIDLITLFKALKEGIYYKENDKVKQFIPNDEMHIVADCNGSEERTNYWVLSIFDCNSKEWLIDFWFDNYGKTWALTKEELLEELL